MSRKIKKRGMKFMCFERYDRTKERKRKETKKTGLSYIVTYLFGFSRLCMALTDY